MTAAHRATRSEDHRSLRSKPRTSYQEPATEDEDFEASSASSENVNQRRLSAARISSRSPQTERVSRKLSNSRNEPSHKAGGVSTTTRMHRTLRDRSHVSLAGSDSDEILYETSRKRKTISKKRSSHTSKSPHKSRHRPERALVDAGRDEILYESRKRKRSPQERTSYHSKLSRPRTTTYKTKDKKDIAGDILPLGKIPPWTILPYQILLQIFQYLASPPYDPRTFQITPNAEKLLKYSRLCKDFAEPALTALYRIPVLAPMERAHKLGDLLQADEQNLMSFNYRSKIEAIHMEISQTAAYSLSGRGLLDLHNLMYHLPRLQELELYHRKDMSPYRELDHSVKWNYPESLFVALEKNVEGVPTRLKSWRWSSRLAKNIPLEQMVDYHRKPYFVSLEKVAICNYHIPRIKKGELDPEHELRLVEALSALPSLKHLVLESSTLINNISMPLLPSVQRLEIINCWEVTSADLIQYLGTHGHQLRHLILNHNVSLNLSLLSQLGSLCPKLELLSMDLTYFSVHQSYRDSDPNYEHLFEPDETPQWPSSLRVIEMQQLQRWDIVSAQRFYQSLLDSAESLPDLRTLIVKGILNIGWRERVAFREKWVELLPKVFLRKTAPPNTHNRSISMFYAHRKASADKNVIELSENDDSEIVKEHGLKRHRLEQGPIPAQRIQKNDRSLRQRSRATVYREESSDDSEQSAFDEESDRETGRPTPPPSSTRKSIPTRELDILRRTAGFDSPKPPCNNTVNSAISITDDDDVDSDDTPLVNKAKSGKGKERQIERVDKPQFIHGMCNVVEIQIDNIRPAEHQYTARDFLDSEPEGDEDWDGTAEDALEARGGRYAW